MRETEYDRVLRGVGHYKAEITAFPSLHWKTQGRIINTINSALGGLRWQFTGIALYGEEDTEVANGGNRFEIIEVAAVSTSPEGKKKLHLFSFLHWYNFETIRTVREKCLCRWVSENKNVRCAALR